MSDDRYRRFNSTLSASISKTRAWHRSGKPPERKTPLKPVNRERKAKRKAEGEVYGPRHRFCSELPCIIAGKEGHVCMSYRDGVLVKGHHLVPVSRGGKDAGNVVPMCWKAHTAVHWSPTRFEIKWDVDLVQEAIRVDRMWRASDA